MLKTEGSGEESRLIQPMPNQTIISSFPKSGVEASSVNSLPLRGGKRIELGRLLP
jgi:hypothetical protein